MHLYPGEAEYNSTACCLELFRLNDIIFLIKACAQLYKSQNVLTVLRGIAKGCYYRRIMRRTVEGNAYLLYALISGGLIKQPYKIHNILIGVEKEDIVLFNLGHHRLIPINEGRFYGRLFIIKQRRVIREPITQIAHKIKA